MFGGIDGDLEKTPKVGNAPIDDNSDEAVPGEIFFEYSNSMYAKIQRLAGKLNIEQRGIEWTPEDVSIPRTLKLAACGSRPIWWLIHSQLVSWGSPYMGLASILVDILFNLSDIMTVCLFSCFGPAFGWQMVLSRFWFG